MASALREESAVVSSKHFWLGISSVCLLMCLGCTFVRLQRDLDRLETAVRIEGVLSASERSVGPFHVSLIAHASGERLVRKVWFTRAPSEFMFLVEAGTYSLIGFEDTNENGIPDEGEMSGETDTMLLKPGDAWEIGQLSLSRSHAMSPAAGEALFASQAGVSLMNENISFGSVASLEAPQFSRENAVVGYWQPLTFLRQTPSGLFMLQPFESDKVPVVFVHGATGYAREFSELIGAIDRSRFQPWVFSYPSGLSLELSALMLAQTVNRTAAQLNVPDIVLVAHSMGGLVSRRFILDDAEQGRAFHPKLFVSISSPWGGHAATSTGVAHAPAVVPSWRQMQPEGEFLRALFASAIPPEIPYYLLFGFRSRGVSLQENNDGVVALKSVLRLEAQSEARRVRGFDVDHADILRDPASIAEIQRILAEEAPRLSTASGRSKKRLSR